MGTPSFWSSHAIKPLRKLSLRLCFSSERRSPVCWRCLSQPHRSRVGCFSLLWNLYPSSYCPLRAEPCPWCLSDTEACRRGVRIDASLSACSMGFWGKLTCHMSWMVVVGSSSPAPCARPRRTEILRGVTVKVDVADDVFSWQSCRRFFSL